ncbi:MAG TPA: hypothetical protein GX499_09550 [Clostridiales bacterium]|nr:hypothetical protein [Clostridiales bacterium]
MKKIIAIAGIALAIPLAFTLLLKALHLMQGLISKILSALLWCLSVVVVVLLLQKKLTGRRCR